MASTIPYPSRVRPAAPSLASRWRMSLSRTNGRSKLARAGTSLAGIAGSSGRKTGTPISERPVWRRNSAFQVPCTGIGSVVR